jgi:hypothetical protein
LTIGPQHRLLQLSFSLPAWTVLSAQSLYRDYSGAWGIHYAVNCGVMSLMATYLDTVLLASPDKEGWTKLSTRVGLMQRGKEKGEGDKESAVVGSSGFPRDDGDVVKSKSSTIADDKSTAKSAAPTGFRSRLWWATRIACTNRYTGWSCEVKNVPIEVPSSYPRW